MALGFDYLLRACTTLQLGPQVQLGGELPWTIEEKKVVACRG
jgi:hypothetical protein